MFSKLARILVVPAVIAALGIPAIAASASPTHSSAPAVTGTAGYRYAYSYDSGNSSGHAGEQISADFYSQPEAVLNNGSHSDTQFYIGDAAGDAVELGINTEPTEFGNSDQYLFGTSWTAGVWDGNIGSSSYSGPIFHSTSTVKFNSVLADDQWDAFGISYTDDQVQFYFGNNEIGYIPAGDWPGSGWTGNAFAYIYGESDNAVSGATLPDMNGGVKNFYGSGTTLGDFSIDSPYSIHSTSPTGFTFSGPS